jgi:6-phosphogluconolactonase
MTLMFDRIRSVHVWKLICLVLFLLVGSALAVAPSHAGDQTSAQAADRVSGGQRVFSAGHSFHVFVPGILNDMVTSAGIQGHVPVGLSSIGGSRVIQHWDVPEEKNKAKEALRTGNVDVLTLSPIHLPDEGIENFTKLALEYNPRVRVTIQEFWLPFDIYETTFKQRPTKVDHNAPAAGELRDLHAPYFKSMDEHVNELNKQLGRTVLYVVPVGQAVIALREKIIAGQAPGLTQQEDLFTDAIGHAKPPLQALVAYCHFAVIYRRSPVGLSMPAILSNANNPNWDAKLNRLLQELAWDAVTQHPLSGVKAEVSPTDVASNTFLYVSMAPEQKIQIYQLDANTGALTTVETVAVEGAPGALVVDQQKKFLYASHRSNSTLASYRIDSATGKLKRLSTAALPTGENAAFLKTDRTGRWLLSASYAAGKVVVHRLNEDGMIESPAVQTVPTALTAHCVATDPENRFVFVPHVTPNAVYQFHFDSKTGTLTEAGKAPGGAEKAGPRHLAFHPTQNLAFTSNEQGSSITAYRYDPAAGLTPVQTLSTLPPDFKGRNTTADVKVYPSGRFVWVSNRGHDSLAGFAIDSSGKLSPLGHTPTEQTPRSFEIDPSGRFAFGAGEGSGKLAVFQIDRENGTLRRLHTYDVGKSLTWVLAVQLGNY